MRLLKKSKKEIREHYPKLYSRARLSYFTRIIRYFRTCNFKIILTSYILTLISILLYSKFLNFEFLQIIKLDYKNIIAVITTSIITLVSINLLVTNFLFTFLKDEIDDLQSIIDKTIHYKFPTYLGFSIIISVLILFFIGGSIGNDTATTNILIFIFYTFILYIFIIVNLYNRVFDFLNRNKRSELLKKEIFKEFYFSFYIFKLKQLFYSNYKKFYGQLEIEEELNHFFPTKQHKHFVVFETTKDLYLRDVKLNALSRELKNYESEKIRFYSLNFDQQFKNTHTSKIISSEDVIDERKIRSAFILSRKRNIQEPTIEELATLEMYIENSIDKKDFEKLEQNLNVLEEVYKTYLDIEYGNRI